LPFKARSVTDSGVINLADAINLLSNLFFGTDGTLPIIPEPNFGNGPGLDPTDDELGCERDKQTLPN
jgi:hypothetical protein